MKAKVIFWDWTKHGKSIYQTEEGVELSSRDFHSGSTFNAEITLNEEQEAEMKEALAEGYEPLFLLVEEGL